MVMKVLRGKLNITYVKILLVVFYLVGIIGFSIPISKQIFESLIPFALTLTFLLLMLYHESGLKQKITMMLIAVLGFAIEVIGVKTGNVFGEYHYSNALGPKLINTPLFIGINWLMLTYSAYYTLNKRISMKIPLVFIGALLITFFDFIMEPVAIQVNMWNWNQGFIPIQNYLAWFVISFIFLIMLNNSGKGKNELAPWVFFIQLVFFSVMNLLL